MSGSVLQNTKNLDDATAETTTIFSADLLVEHKVKCLL